VSLAIALRAVHFAAAVALFGEFVFALCIARPDAAASRRLLRVAAWSLALLVVSGALWLAAQAQAMSGAPLAQALSRETLVAVLGETLFGRVSVVRFALAVALAIVLVLLRDGGLRAAGALLSGALLATLAWTGHAAAEQGADRAVHLSADALHLIAAGAWVGALWPLAVALRTEDAALAERAARRFSTVGMASVGTLVVTGVANAWYTVGSVPALFGTGYGRLLTAKLALFGAMLALAAVNRLRLTPRLPDPRSLAQLRRNAALEALLGLVVIAVVGALGVTVPALHVQIAWPFRYTLDPAAAEGAEGLVGALLVAPLVALGIVAAGLRTRRRALAGAGIAVFAAACASGAWLFAVPTVPTRYFRSPVRYAADSIARGAPLYAAHCAGCHGARATGDGPAAASLAVRPTNLVAHRSHHREGDMFWWIERGIPGTPMPGLEGRVGERGVWDVLNFLRARADAEEVLVLGASVQPGFGVVAPDFTFQVGTRTQESLGGLRGRSAVLLVFYALPGSLARLRELAGAARALERLGLRVVALPLGRELRAASPAESGMLADPDARVVSVYAMFGRRRDGAPEPAEFLVDRQGWLRARWAPDVEPGWSPAANLVRQVQALSAEPLRASAPARHVH
jgi:copper resistance protein D